MGVKVARSGPRGDGAGNTRVATFWNNHMKFREACHTKEIGVGMRQHGWTTAAWCFCCLSVLCFAFCGSAMVMSRLVPTGRARRAKWSFACHLREESREGDRSGTKENKLETQWHTNELNFFSAK